MQIGGFTVKVHKKPTTLFQTHTFSNPHFMLGMGQQTQAEACMFLYEKKLNFFYFFNLN